MSAALFGGSFDPVHDGHVAIITKLSERFDRVVVMPTAVSPFKMQGGAASPEQRLSMLRLCQLPSNVEVSDYEIMRGGVSYTANTLKALVKRGYTDISVVIGSEELPYLDKWRENVYLKGFEFYVIPRPGFSLNEELKKDYNCRVADFVGDEVSSAMIKVNLAFGKNARLPSSVLKYVKENGLYTEWNKYTDAYPLFNMKASRIEHTYGTVRAGVELAKRYGADVNEVILALILHDIGKYCTAEFLKSMGIVTPPDVEKLPEPLRHAHYGEAIAEQYFGIRNASVLNAIRNHTTCVEGMDICSQITALADYIEPGRNFEGVDEVRALAKISLTQAITKMLELTLSHLNSVRADIGVESVKAYEFYKKLSQTK